MYWVVSQTKVDLPGEEETSIIALIHADKSNKVMVFRVPQELPPFFIKVQIEGGKIEYLPYP
ncbi:MAG: hypothetical protein A3H02_00230 [Candidatus Niyogibacteria bacterium RIFCSPLOWO2_12_FULL_41_13]|uniref:Uncharacterized protein n=1 Tax=Candidatus Niyogibacteria bacterium RIFCSPLOWO2_12_FULL_41_13 TaxID=1801726 RepID=A0A1G2F3C9_9BACT|nr:MAG: hypothetical protein A3H02_00230 [Candidatus Niyogibacteria bacterium RIFCSPLOWO2_12_FULL_41_13]